MQDVTLRGREIELRREDGQTGSMGKEKLEQRCPGLACGCVSGFHNQG